jgi:hypothetical protein
MPKSYSLLSSVTDFIGAPLSECNTRGSPAQRQPEFRRGGRLMRTRSHRMIKPLNELLPFWQRG